MASERPATPMSVRKDLSQLFTEWAGKIFKEHEERFEGIGLHFQGGEDPHFVQLLLLMATWWREAGEDAQGIFADFGAMAWYHCRPELTEMGFTGPGDLLFRELVLTAVRDHHTYLVAKAGG